MTINRFLISKKNVFIVLITVFIALLLPLIAMQFTHEVNWQISDFIAAAVLFSFFCYLYKVLTKSTNNKKHNIVIALLLFGLLLFVWQSLI
jgi:Kef-type K+ transport system membrane component KefB